MSEIDFQFVFGCVCVFGTTAPDLFYVLNVSVCLPCRFHERLLPDQIQSAGSFHQRPERSLPEEQRLLRRPLLTCRPNQTQGHAHQEGSQETRSVTGLITSPPRIDSVSCFLTIVLAQILFPLMLPSTNPSSFSLL